MKILLIVPAYNEEENILNTCNKIKEFSKAIDFIVINDGSKDNTEKILKENNLKHITLIENLGIGGAVQTGYKYAYKNDYDIAIQFDGDGQHDVNYIPNICEPIINGKADMVIGTRYLDKESSSFKSTFMRRMGSSIISLLIQQVSKIKITDPTSGFRAVNKDIIKIFAKDYPTDYPEPESIVDIKNLNYRIVEVPVNMSKREARIFIYKSMEKHLLYGKSITCNYNR